MLRDLVIPKGDTKFLFFGGKGGVGKSTTSAATAVWLADQGNRTLLISTDLQRSPSDIFGQDIGYQATEIPGVTGLVVMETEPKKLVQNHWHKLAGEVQDVFGPSELLELMTREVSPCMMEMAGFYQLMELYTEGTARYDAIVFDTAPGGRALIEITLPFTMARRYGGGGDPFAQFRVPGLENRTAEIARQEERTKRTMELITDPARTIFLYVLWPESLPVAETQRAIDELREHGIDVPGLLINELLPEEEIRRANTDYFWKRYEMQQIHYRDIKRLFSGRAMADIPLFPTEVRGVRQLRKLAEGIYS